MNTGTLIAGGQHLRHVQAGEAAGEEAEEDGVREAALQVGAARPQDHQQGTRVVRLRVSFYRAEDSFSHDILKRKLEAKYSIANPRK